MKTIFTFTAIFCSLTIYANNPKIYPPKISQYNYVDFMDKYAIDDTSTVIIDLFLNKRNEQGATELSFLPITGTIALIVPPIGIPLTAIYSPVAIHGCYIRVKYSKKKLEKTLKKYTNGEKMSNHLSKKIKKHYRLMKLENALQY